MKFYVATTLLVIAFAVSGHALNAEKSKSIEKFTQECIKETGTTMLEVEKLRKGDFNSPTEKTECFAKCLLERGGLMEKGKFNEKKIDEKLKEMETKDKIDKILKACKEVKGKNECQIAFNALKCYSEHKAAIA